MGTQEVTNPDKNMAYMVRQVTKDKLLISKLCPTTSPVPALPFHGTSHFSLRIINFPYVMRFHWKCEIVLPEASPVSSEEASPRQPAGGVAVWTTEFPWAQGSAVGWVVSVNSSSRSRTENTECNLIRSTQSPL